MKWQKSAIWRQLAHPMQYLWHTANPRRTREETAMNRFDIKQFASVSAAVLVTLTSTMMLFAATSVPTAVIV